MEAVSRAITRVSTLIDATDEAWMLANLIAVRDDLREALVEQLEEDE